MIKRARASPGRCTKKGSDDITHPRVRTAFICPKLARRAMGMADESGHWCSKRRLRHRRAKKDDRRRRPEKTTTGVTNGGSSGNNGHGRTDRNFWFRVSRQQPVIDGSRHLQGQPADFNVFGLHHRNTRHGAAAPLEDAACSLCARALGCTPNRQPTHRHRANPSDVASSQAR